MSIGVKVGLFLLLICTLVAGGLGAYSYQEQHARLESEMEEAVDAARKRLELSLASALYDFAKTQIEGILDAEMSCRHIASLVVLDNNGTFVSGRARYDNWTPFETKEAPANSGNLESRVFDIVRAADTDAEKVGVLKITLDDRFVREESLKLRRQSLIQVLVLDGILVVLLWLMLQWQVSSPLKGISRMLRDVAHGDLTKRVSSRLFARRDEIGDMSRAMQALNDNLQNEVVTAFDRLAQGDLTFNAQGIIREPLRRTAELLSATISRINEVADLVSSDARRISDTSQSLSHGAIAQASSLVQVAASMTEIGHQTQKNAEGAVEANRLAKDARNATEQGSIKMQAMMGAMQDMTTSSQQISKIIKVIDDIAFQTKLLALNASMEAARAGEHGKGFAAVANAVRMLAIRSAQAAQETALLIEETVKQVEGGMQTATDMAGALEIMANHIATVDGLVGKIASASTDQAREIAQINRGLLKIDEVAHQNTTHAGHTAATAEQLSKQAAHQKEMLLLFKLRNESAINETGTKDG